MERDHSLTGRTIVLLGMGHTNALILRKWGMSRLPDTRLVCVSNFPVSTYSGMLPGVLAGDYEPRQMTIDLVRLCSAAGALLILDDTIGLDAERRLLFSSRPPLAFDVLSVGIGSVPVMEANFDADAPVVPIKPMQTFRDRLSRQLQSLLDDSDRRPIRVAVVGGGVAGAEVTLCLPPFLAAIAKSGSVIRAEFSFTLIQRDDEIVPGVSRGLRARTVRTLSARGVTVVTGRAVEQVARHQLTLDDGTTLDADLVIWATGARAPDLLQRLGLPTDQRGFLLTDHSLKSTADVPVFAVGDSGTIASEPLPKAGVYAVRQAPVLWENLQRILDGSSLREYRPQRRFLKLMNCGDGTAMGEYGPVSFQGSWVWRLKEWIDTRFMDRFLNVSAMSTDDGQTRMRCHGCGSKVASDDLFSVLRDVSSQRDATQSQTDDVTVGLNDCDDAAVVRLEGGQELVLTTDFFPAPFDDAYLSGRIAALHAMSDIFAMGARPAMAMALVTIPAGPSPMQRQVLADLLHGARQEFEKSQTALVGGHTTEGTEMTIGFSVIGQPWGNRLCRKGRREDRRVASTSDASPSPPLQSGDRLILTKPLGTGVLLAAHRQARCDADWYVSLVDSLLRSVAGSARLAWEAGTQWMTDVSGFGLAGHLLELLQGQRLCAELNLSAIPVLPGSVELSAAGVVSSLYEANRQAAIGDIEFATGAGDQPKLPLLFDPQTCGGLLIALPEEAAKEFVRDAESESSSAVVIGRIISAASAKRIRIVDSARDAGRTTAGR